ncbi:MAG: metallophosphoesterase, partial [Deltaproteobacteria bacterium]|nr:metallophosphoesterase [Deltaproteobacteria bacterium]
MIWVIGDIHGMISPLERILEAIRQYARDEEKADKVIFLGDYTDHGNYSKEVLETLIELDLPAVYLAGNHDDMAIRFFQKTPSEIYDYDQWFTQGAYQTMISLLSDSEALDKFQNAWNENFGRFSSKGRDFRPQEKYVKFFESLTYSHKETFFQGDSILRFRFFHGLPRIDLPLDDQMSGDFNDFQKFLATPRKHNLRFPSLCPNDDLVVEKDGLVRSFPYVIHEPIGDYLDHTALWGRGYNFFYSYIGDGVIVHGHTPTLTYHKNYNSESTTPKEFEPMFLRYKLESHLPFLFSKDQSSGYVKLKPNPVNGDIVKFNPGKHGFIEAINIDTGAVYKGGSLTALGLSERLLAKGQLLVLTTPTIPSDEPTRTFSENALDKPESAFPKTSSVISRIIEGARFSPLPGEVLYPEYPMERIWSLNREKQK